MRVLSFLFTQHLTQDEDAATRLKDLAYDIARYFKNVHDAVNGRLTFGDGISIDNIAGKWIDLTSHTSGGTETAIQHDLGVVPVGFLLVIPPASGTIVRGATAWTTTHIYLTFSANSQTARLFLLVPPLSS
jgi:hypothetical protein